MPLEPPRSQILHNEVHKSWTDGFPTMLQIVCNLECTLAPYRTFVNRYTSKSTPIKYRAKEEIGRSEISAYRFVVVKASRPPSKLFTANNSLQTNSLGRACTKVSIKLLGAYAVDV